ncbi:hypothetical protein BFC19_12300 (plasmid) [Brochothrix thermosphacta]|uniref:type IA DNA topoisomerase n=1 Tax=Brochothrix thermosphacta TaxID=2756 RepID=UPI000E73EEA6|nr:type IA DNA topoisomerase [Brochothrix thermosphacta]ANZ96217.1 hypothetical protein BFC19_12300 [Brochothrix thermosphacta]
MKVILAEKPKQAEVYAKALSQEKPKKINNSHFKISTDILGEVIVTWGIGHLVGLAYPVVYDEKYKRFDMANYPFLPEELIYEVSKATKTQFKEVKALLEDATEIIIATDPDREGENIAYNIFKKCNQKIKSIPKKRLWINSMEEKEVRKGFSNLKEASDTVKFYEEANARQIADYLVGMNFTGFFTDKLQKAGVHGMFSVGRVQTPVNTIIVENDAAIKNFKPQPFKNIEAHSIATIPNVVFKNKEDFFNDTDFEAVMSNYHLKNATQGVISKKEIVKKKTESPKLFSLGGIQKYASTKWKYSPKITLDTIQSLYNNGYLSYPRTDCDLITTSEFDYLKQNLEVMKNLLSINIDTPQIEARKRYVNNTKVLEHYAIIPTEKLPTLSYLNDKERNIYESVLKHTLMMFMTDYTYEQTNLTLDVNGFLLTATGNVPLTEGWKILKTEETKKEKTTELLPAVTEGETRSIKIAVKDKKTKPPRRLTDGILVGKGGVMDKLGLGTPATRSSCVETLITREYITSVKSELFPTEKGKLLYELTKDTLLGKPELTANWETYLHSISAGNGSRTVFISNIKKFVSEVIEKQRVTDLPNHLIEDTKNMHKFSVGDYQVEEKAKVYDVTHTETQIKFVIFKTIASKKISLKTVEKLLTKKKTGVIKGFTSAKTKKSFSARLELAADNKIKFNFEK